MKGKLYSPLKDISLFEKVQIDQIAKTLIWPNGADFDSETLRNWDFQKESLKEIMKNWWKYKQGVFKNKNINDPR